MIGSNKKSEEVLELLKNSLAHHGVPRIKVLVFIQKRLNRFIIPKE